jgi:hypothetical protein
MEKYPAHPTKLYTILKNKSTPKKRLFWSHALAVIQMLRHSLAQRIIIHLTPSIKDVAELFLRRFSRFKEWGKGFGMRRAYGSPIFWVLLPTD